MVDSGPRITPSPTMIHGDWCPPVPRMSCSKEGLTIRFGCTSVTSQTGAGVWVGAAEEVGLVDVALVEAWDVEVALVDTGDDVDETDPDELVETDDAEL